jgi:histidine triad (HIT) family protein
MSLDGVYDQQNIFAKILRGEIPAAKILEDEATLAFMDAFPQARGHCLVIHRTATARNLLDIEAQDLGVVMQSVQRVARAVRAALNPDGIMISQFNGAASGQTVFHLHVHIIPRWQDIQLGRHGGGAMANFAELRSTAAEIAARLQS